ncbi:MAG: hypothetical protein J2P49_04045 [Methylocapsa sp.]|nr:hypothetical protein [Methylocapsa sp.]
MSKEIVEELRQLAAANKVVRDLFDYLSKRARSSKFIRIDQFCKILDISSKQAVYICRTLERSGCGKFITGRRGHRSRFEWHFNFIKLGKAAAGEEIEFVSGDDSVLVSEDRWFDEEVMQDKPSAGSQTPAISIVEAKTALAQSLGVPLTAVEITVKA